MGYGPDLPFDCSNDNESLIKFNLHGTYTYEYFAVNELVVHRLDINPFVIDMMSVYDKLISLKFELRDESWTSGGAIASNINGAKCYIIENYIDGESLDDRISSNDYIFYYDLSEHVYYDPETTYSYWDNDLGESIETHYYYYSEPDIVQLFNKPYTDINTPLYLIFTPATNSSYSYYLTKMCLQYDNIGEKQWRIVGTEQWYNSGEVISDLEPGTYDIEFNFTEDKINNSVFDGYGNYKKYQYNVNNSGGVVNNGGGVVMM